MWSAYWGTAATSVLDQVILVFGGLLMAAHLLGLVMRVHGRRVFFVQGLPRYRTLLLLLTEILPVLGLLGTVFGLMNTFAAFAVPAEIGGGEPALDLTRAVAAFAPALSTTISGLLMIVPNLLLNCVLWMASTSPRGLSANHPDAPVQP